MAEHCRACMSVEELMKRAQEMRKKKQVSGSGSKPISEKVIEEVGAGKMRKDCPLDTEELGRSTWNLLHTMAAYYPEKPSDKEKSNARSMMKLLGQVYPCTHCAEDLRHQVEKKPPDVESREKFSLWMCDLHNQVNKKLGKAIFDCSQWKERWLNGWKDGSCDY